MSDDNRYAFVTGASRGIGKAIAEQLEKEGFSIVAAASNETSVPDTQSHYKWIFIDFAVEDIVTSIIKDIPEEIRFDVVINNAGINRIIPVPEVSPEDFDAVFNVNMKAPYFIIKSLLPKMNRGARIVNIASIWSVLSMEKRSLYSSAKSALAGLTRALAVEFADMEILVNTVSPGFTKTDLTESSLGKKEMESITNKIPLKRMAEIEEIAKIVCFLAGSQNTYITGQNIIIDGGYTIV